MPVCLAGLPLCGLQFPARPAAAARTTAPGLPGGAGSEERPLSPLGLVVRRGGLGGGGAAASPVGRHAGAGGRGGRGPSGLGASEPARCGAGAVSRGRTPLSQPPDKHHENWAPHTVTAAPRRRPAGAELLGGLPAGPRGSGSPPPPPHGAKPAPGPRGGGSGEGPRPRGGRVGEAAASSSSSAGQRDGPGSVLGLRGPSSGCFSPGGPAEASPHPGVRPRPSGGRGREGAAPAPASVFPSGGAAAGAAVPCPCRRKGFVTVLPGLGFSSLIVLGVVEQPPSQLSSLCIFKWFFFSFILFIFLSPRTVGNCARYQI